MNVDTEVAARPAVRGPWAGAVTLTVDHKPRLLRIEPRVSLLDACDYRLYFMQVKDPPALIHLGEKWQ